MHEVNYRPITYYTKFAERVIYKYIKIYKLKLTPSDEMIGYVANSLMQAEGKYDYDKVSEKCKKDRTEEECRKYFLRSHAIYSIRGYMYRRNKKKKYVLSTDIFGPEGYNFLDRLFSSKTISPQEEKINLEIRDEIERNVNILIHNAGLTEKQKSVVNKHIMDGKSFAQIAKESDPPVKPQAVNKSYQLALGKMRLLVK